MNWNLLHYAKIWSMNRSVVCQTSKYIIHHGEHIQHCKNDLDRKNHLPIRRARNKSAPVSHKNVPTNLDDDSGKLDIEIIETDI
ncbi:hypothetical protein Ocin01_08997 [Orchesella cincta]|uniref:Uncharacterized protein n=1 Tax=Orchesella cincta TaxID=48709 RepID=A0A1D2MXL5_ORCCI|nr:hypothetical protein Ocin01_08997 [Orchesella cincta]